MSEYADSGSGGHVVQVTRNVPPKRVRVLPGNSVVYGDKQYTGGDEFVMGDGPAADQLAFAGHVVVVDHEATEAWNGAEGEHIREQALAALDAQHKREGSKRTHHHGFARYKHADGAESAPADLTQDRQKGGQR
jgi:hypothetical protein